MNTYVVRTHLSEIDLSIALSQIDEEGVVDYMEDSIILSKPIDDSPQILLIDAPENERILMSLIPTYVLEWKAVLENICPACSSAIEVEAPYANGYCGNCGLSWTENKVWFECFTIKDDAEEAL